MKKIEVIAWTKQDAIDIEKASAHRVELVIELEKGGLSPSKQLVKEVVESVSIPVRIMVRDNDESFVYDESVMKIHIEYIKSLKELNPDGIIFGSITKDKRINFEQLKQVIDAKGNMKLTFHRAFDELNENALEEFIKLANYDVDTLLTSGTKESALDGKELIKTLVDKKKINILPGKSISIKNAKEIVEFTGADYIHVGFAVREDGTSNSRISKKKIQDLIKEINND